MFPVVIFPPHDVDAVQASNQLERSGGFIDIRIPFEWCTKFG